MRFSILGVVVYGLVKKEKMGGLVNAMLFSTGIAPLITDLLIRYPYAEAIGFNWLGLGLALLVGLIIGFFLPAGLAHSPKVHKGFDLYSAALPIGMTAFFLNATLFKTLGVSLPKALSDADAANMQVASQSTVNIFCGIVFGLCIVFAFLLVTSVPTLHGGFCLYNGGFTAALICLILVPELEKFFKTKEERKLAKVK